MVRQLMTNNTSILKKFLGDDYVARYESVRNKLYYAIQDMNKENDLISATWGNFILEHGIEGLGLPMAVKNKAEATEVLNSWYNDAVSEGSKRNYVEDAIFYRRPDATCDSDFFRTTALSSIVEVRVSTVAP